MRERLWYPQMWYYNTTDPLAEPTPFHDSYGPETIIEMAERREYLIIFEMSIDEYNRIRKESLRLGSQITYEEYAEEMRKYDRPPSYSRGQRSPS